MKILMTQWTEHTSTELASKPELLRKLFEKTGYLPNTDLGQATRREFTFATRTAFTFVLDNKLETLREDYSGDYIIQLLLIRS